MTTGELVKKLFERCVELEAELVKVGKAKEEYLGWWLEARKLANDLNDQLKGMQTA